MKINFSRFLKKQNILLSLLILIGAYLRIPGVLGNYFAFTYDVGRDMLAVYDIVFLHKIPLVGAIFGGAPSAGIGIFYGPWWYYFLSLPYVLSFGNPQGVVLAMALIGIVTIFFGYLFGKRIGGNFLGLAFAALIAVSPILISLSSQIWNPNVSPIIVIFCLAIIYRIYSENKPKLRYYFILGFLIALVIDLEIVFGVLLAIGLILAVTVIKNKQIQFKSIISFFVGVFIIFSPRIIFELRHQFLMTTSLFKFLTTSGNSQSSNLIKNFANIIVMIFNQFNSTIALNNEILGIIIILFIVLTTMLFYKKASLINKQFIKTSLIVLFTFLTGLIFFHHDIFGYYLIGLPVFYLLLFCLSINLVIQNTKNYVIPGIIILVLFLINLNPVAIINNLGKSAWVGDASVYKNQLQVVDYIYGQARGKSFKEQVYTPPIYDYPYRYLFKWYGPNKYHYGPDNNSHLAFFILEPDLQYPSRLTDWLKFREKDGKIIKTETFKSGIIVQTRIH